MKAYVIDAIGEVALKEVAKPQIDADEVLVQVKAAGICGSDIPRIFTLGTSRQEYPLTIGHEFGGEIVAVGPDEDQSLVGKKGAIFPLIPCRECEPCLMGEYCMCEDYDYLGSRNDEDRAYSADSSTIHTSLPEEI